jgi:hypothetical protein
MSTKNTRPVQDLGMPKPEVPYRAGGKDQGNLATRKAALSDAGTIGFTPRGTGRASYVHEAPQKSGHHPDDPELEYASRPLPREQAVSSTPGHAGALVRFADGHTEVHRERPDLVGLLGNPHVHPDDKDEIRQEIAMRDSLHSHRYW